MLPREIHPCRLCRRPTRAINRICDRHVQKDSTQLRKTIRDLRRVVQAILDSEDSTGCSDDLTVVSREACRAAADLLFRLD